MRYFFCLLFTFGTCISSTFAQATLPVTFLGDNNTSVSAMLSASGFTKFGSNVYFSGQGPHGSELYKTDGISSVLVKDIWPGHEASLPRQLFEFNGYLFFVANDGIHGTELWKTDGTTSGTSMVKDINPGGSGTTPWPNFSVANNLLFFVAQNEQGRVLYKSDGTPEGTNRVSNVFVTDRSKSIAAAGDYVIFSGSTTTDYTLWRTDGSDSGTTEILDTYPGIYPAHIDNLESLNGKVYFTASAPGINSGLWECAPADNMATTRLTPPEMTNVSQLTRVGNKIMFTANHQDLGVELWALGGVFNIPYMVHDLVPGSGASYPSNLVAAGDRLFFNAQVNNNVSRPWVSSGAYNNTFPVTEPDGKPFPAGLYHIADVNGTAYISNNDLWKITGATGTATVVREFDSVPFNLTGVSNDLYFSLQSYNGVGASMRYVPATDELVGVGISDTASFQVQKPIVYNGKCYFSAWDGLSGWAPWTTDGTVGSLNQIFDYALIPKSNGTFRESSGRLYYSASLNGSGQLYAVSGSDAEPLLLNNKFQSSYILGANGYDYFLATATHPYSYSVVRTDGTTSGTVDISLPYIFGLAGPPLTTQNGLIIAVTQPGGRSLQLYRADNTTNVLTLVKELDPNPAQNYPVYGITSSNGLAYFITSAGSLGRELWRSDGTEAGTYVVADISPGSRSTETQFSPDAGGRLYLFVPDINKVSMLWTTDGTTTGTRAIAAVEADKHLIDTGPDLSHARSYFVEINGRVLFPGRTAISGSELWVTDGTSSGTNILKDIMPGPQGSTIGRLVKLGDRVFFNANDGIHGNELWSSDGTIEGTQLVTDINIGAGSSNPMELLAHANKLLFSADDGVHGYEPWIADPADVHAILIADIEPGAASSSPSLFRGAGNRLIFTAKTTATGVDLWSVDLGTASVVGWELY